MDMCLPDAANKPLVQRELFTNWLENYDDQVPQAIRDLIARGAQFWISHSGGKDSQSMYAFVKRHVPASQIHVVHAVLPEVDWEGVEGHIRANIDHDLHVCKSRRTLLEMIEQRGMFPSPSQRQCTSDLKRGPIERTIRQSGHKLIVSCMGIRAQESSSRSKLATLKLSDRNSKAGREWHEWLPIFNWDVTEVFSFIEQVGQKPHWAYEKGMSRLSCVFCIMANRQDLTTAAKLNPVLYKRYVELEKSTGQVMLMPSKKNGRLSLEQVTGIAA